MNTPLHMEAYALNPKWYIERPSRIAPIDDPEIKKGFRAAITKMYDADEAKKIQMEWIHFACLNGPFDKPDAKENRNDIGQEDPIDWWRMHGDDAPEIQYPATHCLRLLVALQQRGIDQHIASSTLSRVRLTSRRAKKLVAVHDALRLAHRRTPKYPIGPMTRWDVDPEDDAHTNEKGPDEA